MLKKLSLIVAAVALSSTSAFALAPVAIQASIEIVDTVVVETQSDLYFGMAPSGATVTAFVAGSGCAAVPAPAGLVTTGGNIGFIDLGGTFALQNATIQVDYPTQLLFGALPLVPTFDAYYCGDITTPEVPMVDAVATAVVFTQDIPLANNTLNNVVYFGGEVVIPAGTLPGIYAGTITTTVLY